MECSFLHLFPTGGVVMNAYPHSDLFVHVTKGKTPIQTLDALMDIGWTIMATWIADESKSTIMDNHVTDVSIRLGIEYERIIMVVDLPLGVALGVVANIDADIPGDNPMIITGMKNSISKLRAASISGYSPYATRGVGLKEPAKMPKLRGHRGVHDHARGRDATAARTPDQHRHQQRRLVRQQFRDECYVIYTFGFHTETKWDDGRWPTILKVDNDGEAVKTAYEILDMLSPDFVSIHDGCNFDLSSIGRMRP
ncbi:hypothetical protein LTR12_015732 [Friedmanniomyces endolithicus]|nr:hypothetical protein LTR12_015732 [Friedmanniomyces endolithicus]